MFKSIRDWCIKYKSEKEKLEQERRDWDREREKYNAIRNISVPPELLKMFIDANPEYMKYIITPIYFPNGQFWDNITCTGNKEGMLEDFIKSFIYGNLERGVPYDKIIEQLNDPNFKMEREDEK